jgi:vacuolar protein sorting-associated protein 11
VGRVSTSDEQDIVIARNEAVYFYDLDGRGPCFGFDGEKKMIMFFRGYLVVVGENQRANELTGGKGVTNSLTIYDLKNKLISCSDTFSTIVQLVAEWGSIFVFCQDGKMYQLKERDTQSKLEILFKKKHFNVAINLANSQQFDQQAIMNIFVKYGNHLYGKGDFDGAMTQ